jgi:Zn-dependent protease with chaperone function
MRYYELMLLAALAVLAVTNTIGSLCLSLTWRKVADAKWTPLARARVLLGLRLAPSLIGALCAALTLIAFLRYEPPSTTEAPSMLLLTGSAVGLGIVMSGLSRGVKRLRDTAKFVAHIERTAAPVVVRGVPLPAWLVDTTFPLVAVTGIWRPRLLIAGNVLTELDEEQLDLVVRHELAHARHGDNMSRLLMAVAPDAVSLYGGARPLEHAWRQAAEEAADDYAVGIDTAARLSLASALLRVARLIGDQPPSRLLVPAFHEGASIEKRIRRLVADNEPPVRALQALRLPLPIGACFLVAGVVLQWDAVLMSIHTAIEWVIHMRP